MPAEPPRSENTVAQIVARARAFERPEVLAIVSSDEVALKIAAAWATPGAVAVQTFEVNDAAESVDQLGVLWERTTIDIGMIARASGTSAAQVRRRLPLLRVNQIVYPDGSVHGLVRRLLQERVLRAFGPARSPRNPGRNEGA
ncbi:MAG: hypothetical protein EPO16_08200 [Dehalococcoidia bacterium]|nr:MAG: hypothetical protein EPO16_08200 [Dehalococcoidia bacterium]